MTRHNIAVDGPSGAGKSTLSKMLAREFGLIYVDTGAMYRTIGLHALRSGVNMEEDEAIVALLPQIQIHMEYDTNGNQLMLLNRENVSSEIRLPEVSMSASRVSAIPQVRRYLLEMQQSIARESNVIMDGRDIGTVVLPDAGLKIFLSADPEDRARRRFEELQQKGVSTSLDEVLKDMIQRDHNDSTRAAAPLRPAEGAVILNTTGYTLEQSYLALYELVKRYMED
ncbi:MAG: (d)CMP kinase [Oscillospiraceae bacterium]|nr:(d)CMP kinase [Oscillospiraceae bacterium]